MSTVNADIYGKGLSFPFRFVRRSGGVSVSVATSQDHTHIHESMRQILGTRRGERFMLAEYGSRLHELTFEQNTVVLHGLIHAYVLEALRRWEPRIVITDITISDPESAADDTDRHMLQVYITYRLIQSQVEGNFVYPFYLEGATVNG